MTSGEMVIDGRFELRGRLGSGGMGTVWRAFDLALEREVALKEVRLADTATSDLDPEVARMLRERMMREARALARLDHPNVVTIHHIVDSPEMPHPWLVMELVRGQSLQERLSQGPLSPAEGAAVGRGLLAALRAAHEAGICHRDVKPANVLLRTDGTPVLTGEPTATVENGDGGTKEAESLLTPAAVRNVIEKFEKATGSKEFAQITVREERASADAPVAGRPGAFDNYTYDKGADAAVRDRPSTGITNGGAKVNPDIFNWDALPELMATAERTLMVRKPTKRYVVAKASLTLNDDQPTMLVFLGDDYGAGYLAANRKGQVIKTSPANS